MPAPKTILHIDMDAFFASIEQRDHPELRGKPVIVGSPPDQRGVVSTCSYEARKFGVHSAMPSRTAGRLCPQGIFVPVDGHKYSLVSKQIRELFYRYTPLVEPISVDEAFLDVTGSLRLFGGARELAIDLKQTIRRETQLTGSVGIASNKFLAKLASDMEKPDGLTMVPREPDAIEAFLAPLPVTRIWGIGGKSAEQLHRSGLRTIGDLQRVPRALLVRLLGEKYGLHVKALAHGLDQRDVKTESPEKSISHEHTFGEDCGDWVIVEETLRDLVQKVARRLRKGQKLGATAQIKVRWEDFQTMTRQRALPHPTHVETPLLEIAMELLEEARQPRPVRLIGFGVSALIDEADAEEMFVQPDFFNDHVERDQRHDQIDHALDRIRAQFGDRSIRRGTGPASEG